MGSRGPRLHHGNHNTQRANAALTADPSPPLPAHYTLSESLMLTPKANPSRIQICKIKRRKKKKRCHQNHNSPRTQRRRLAASPSNSAIGIANRTRGAGARVGIAIGIIMYDSEAMLKSSPSYTQHQSAARKDNELCLRHDSSSLTNRHRSHESVKGTVHLFCMMWFHVSLPDVMATCNILLV